jgi:tellurite resistance protein
MRLSAMITWVGALGAREPATDEEKKGEALAASVLGDEKLAALRSFFRDEAPEVVERERRAAVAACTWMARADRDVTDEEDELLSEVIAQSGLPFDSQLALLATVARPWPLEKIAAELTQPGLRELMLALAWKIAKADDEVAAAERNAHGALAEAFGIDETRARELRDRV